LATGFFSARPESGHEVCIMRGSLQAPQGSCSNLSKETHHEIMLGNGKCGFGAFVGCGSAGLGSGIASSYGAAGSVVVLLVWLYYSAAIMLFGAEVTRAYADRFGSDIIPSEQAVWATDRQLSAAAEAAACEKAE
jgi:hypothetical protein